MEHLLLGVLALLFPLLGGKLLLEIMQRQQLLRWLKDPDNDRLPDGFGLWRDVFSAQHALEKRRRRELQDVEFRLNRFLRATQAIPDGVVLLDDTDHIEWANSVAKTYVGIDIERDRGTLVAQLIRPPAFLRYLQDFHRGAHDGAEPVRVLLDLGDPPRALLMRLIAVGDGMSLLMIRDVSDTIRTERMRRDFVANVSHELRTPITVIGGFLEQLTSEEPPRGEDAKRFLRLMSEQSARMQRLIEDLLVLSRLESDSTIGRDETVNVPQMLVTLVDEARALSGGQHSVQLGEVIEDSLQGNSDELRSAFGNLLSNAIRYTPAGGSITVDWRLQPGTDGQLVFSVTDTGIGIAPEHIPRLTERFYRVDRGRSTATGGTGLGLAIVKHVLSRHDAKLHVQSTPGKGSVFNACFPAARRIPPTS